MSQVITTTSGEKMLVDTRIDASSLSDSEKYVWSTKDVVIKSIGGLPECVKDIIIADTIKYYDSDSFVEGCCRFDSGEILIARTTLECEELFLGVLLHEIAHAKSQAYDETKKFEDELTNFLGYVGSSLVKAVNNNASNVNPAKSLDYRGFGYASCRCVSCMSTHFDMTDDLSLVTCKNCGRTYYGGYQELVSLNRKYIEEHGAGIFLQDILGCSYSKTSNTSMNQDFFGVPITGTFDEFIPKLVEKNLCEPESELSKVARKMNPEIMNGPILFNGIKPEFSNSTIPMFVYPNLITRQIYQVILVFEEDVDFCHYSKALNLLNEVYGKATLKVLNTENYCWNLSNGRIMLIRNESTTIINFCDTLNKPKGEE